MGKINIFKNAKRPTLNMLKESFQCGIVGACFGFLGLLIMASGVVAYVRKQPLGQKRVSDGAKIFKNNIAPMIEMFALITTFWLLHHFVIHPKIQTTWKYALTMIGCIFACVAIMTTVCLVLKCLGLRQEKCPQRITDDHRNSAGILQFPSFSSHYYCTQDKKYIKINNKLAAQTFSQECIDMFFKPFFIILYAIILIAKCITKALSYIIDGIAFIFSKIKTLFVVESQADATQDVSAVPSSSCCSGGFKTEIIALCITLLHFVIAFFPVPFRKDTSNIRRTTFRSQSNSNDHNTTSEEFKCYDLTTNVKVDDSTDSKSTTGNSLYETASENSEKSDDFPSISTVVDATDFSIIPASTVVDATDDYCKNYNNPFEDGDNKCEYIAHQ